MLTFEVNFPVLPSQKMMNTYKMKTKRGKLWLFFLYLSKSNIFEIMAPNYCVKGMLPGEGEEKKKA